MFDKKLNLEWHSMLRDLVKNAWVIFCAVLIGLMGSYIARHSFYSPVYTSHATLIINSAQGKTNAYASLAASSEIANIYTEVFVQKSMKQKVCEYLEMDEFDGEIKAYVNENTNIMELSVTASNSDISYKELCGILTVYPLLTNNLFNNGAVTILKMPAVPKSPSNSMTTYNAILISLVAIVLSSALILALSALRETVKDEKGFRSMIDADLLGVIPHENKHDKIRNTLKGKKHGILLYESVQTSLKFTENFNRIASKLEFIKKTEGKKVFAFTSVAENEGKSTSAANVAISLAMKGNTVVLVDLDGKKPALYKLFEEKYIRESEFGDFLAGNLSAEEYKLRRYKKSKLFLALSTKVYKDYPKWAENGTISRALDSIKKSVDFVIVDTAPVSVDSSVTGITRLCDGVVLVVRTDSVHAPVINDTLLTLKNTGANVSGCILNDEYTEFSLFGQFGTDEAGYAYYSKHGKYGKYGIYHHYGIKSIFDRNHSSGYGNYGKYGSYSKYSKYGHYGKYGKYGKYGHYGKYDNKYDKYSKYDKYGKYGHYGKYGKYSNPGEMEEVNIDPSEIPVFDIKNDDNGGKA